MKTSFQLGFLSGGIDFLNKYTFTIIHIKNTHCFLQRDEAPIHADPSSIISSVKKKINTSQLIPRTSNELKEHYEEYALLKDAL